MSKALQWVVGVCLVLVTLAVVAAVVVPLFVPQAAAAGWSMMGPGGHMHAAGGMMDGARHGGMMDGPMHGGMPAMGMAWFGVSRLLWPLLMVGLVVLGVVGLVRALRPAPAAAPASTPCPKCGQPLLAGWRACPHCGEKTAA